MKKRNEIKMEFNGADRRTGLIPILFLLLIAAGAFHALAQQPVRKDLRLFYQQSCVRCHGADGAALGADGKKLSGADLTDPEFQKKTGDAAMVKIILKGKFFGLAMPGYKDELTEEEAQKLVTDIIRTSQKGKPIRPDVMK
ncbi:MAG: cytochrome c [Pontiellaceae bacterium]|jgi:mono/diheme cytochrome c family protein|nr:cytochrome c [Pontiellaceae bacterium]